MTDVTPAPEGRRRRLPTGTVTFLRTDVEGSMGLARALGPAWDDVNAEHLSLVRADVEVPGGIVVRTEGDAVFAVFPEAGAAVAAAVAIQRALAAHRWPEDSPVRVRIGLHSGEAHLAGDDYGGFDVNRAARVAATGHGGQVILSSTTAALVADGLPTGVALRDLGVYVLKDVPRPERLNQLDIIGLPNDFPPLRATRPATGDLPERLTSFVGRSRELGELATLIAAGRLVTLTGPGGIGKSSLAVETARAARGSYRDGAWFVALAAVDDPSAVKATIARAIGLFDGPERSAADALLPYLGERAVLLVLDNFEHVLDASGDVAAILRASPASHVLVTSRAPLRIVGEQEYPVPPLDGGRRLFVERASSVRPAWDPGADAAAVDEICALVDGLPLGIELAAARISLLPVTAIRDRLAARLPLPGAGLRDAPDRQRTLERTVAWSYDLLTPSLQAVLHDVSVFEDGFDVAQASSVVDHDLSVDVIEELAQLADHSLVMRDRPDGDGIRFRLLRTIQDVGLARLRESGREPATRRRHALAYLALAREAARHQMTVRQATWMHRLSLDDANLRSAVRWSIDAGETEIALDLVAVLWRYWQTDGHLVEGAGLVTETLAMPGADATSTARTWALAAAGNIAYWQGDARTARRWYLEQNAAARALDDEVALADAVFNLTHVEFLENADEGILLVVAEEAEQRFRDLGDERGVARAQWSKPILAIQEGRPEEARDGLLVLRAEFERLGDAQYHAMTTASLGWTAFAMGDLPEACRWAAEGINETYQLGDLGTTTISLHVGVLMAAIAGRPEDAARLTGAFEALSERYGVRPPAMLGRFIANIDPFAMARDALSPDAYADAYETGTRMSLGEAVALVSAIASSVAPGGDADARGTESGLGRPQ